MDITKILETLELLRAFLKDKLEITSGTDANIKEMNFWSESVSWAKRKEMAVKYLEENKYESTLSSIYRKSEIFKRCS